MEIERTAIQKWNKMKGQPLTSIWRAPSFSIRGPGMHLIIASKSGPRSSAKLSGDKPAFPLIPLAYIAWKSHCTKGNLNEIKTTWNNYGKTFIFSFNPLIQTSNWDLAQYPCFLWWLNNESYSWNRLYSCERSFWCIGFITHKTASISLFHFVRK